MRSSQFSTQVSYCGRTGDGVPGCVHSAPRHCSRTGVGVPRCGCAPPHCGPGGRLRLWCAAALQSDGGRRGRLRLYSAAVGCSRTRDGGPGCGCGAPRRGRTGDGVAGRGCGAPRRGRRGRSGDRVCPLRVRSCRVSGLPVSGLPRGPGHPRPARRGLRTAEESETSQTFDAPKGKPLIRAGDNPPACGVPPLLPPKPIYYRTRNRTIEARRPGVPGPLAGPGCPGLLGGPGCPGRPARRPLGR
jgi:hypothetical protein